MRLDRVDGVRTCIGAALTAGLAIGIAAALLYHSRHTSHVGPTSATFSDVASVVGGTCLGLAAGALATALLVRRGSRLASGFLAGVIGFIGAAPFLWATMSSDISAGEKLGGLAVIAIPAAVFVVLGAGLGTGISQRRTPRADPGRQTV